MNGDSSTKPRVLVAEDDRALGDILRLALSKSGYEVTLVHNGNRALQIAQEHAFDVIVSDYQMPGLNGEQFLSAIRPLPHVSDTLLFLCSAKGYEIDTQRLRQSLDLSGVFYKPFSLSELVQAIQVAQLTGKSPAS